MEATENQSAAPEAAPGRHGWTIVLLCLGIGVIAPCLILPQLDENRRAMFECQKLKTDLEHLQRQVSIHDEFIQRAGRDSSLSERLAMRQMKFIRRGVAVMDLDEGQTLQDRSPFSLVTVIAPEPMPECKLVGGRLAEACRDGHKRLYMMGAGLLLMAMGLVLGASRQ